jgi:PadR family transcriptional regulator PadR
MPSRKAEAIELIPGSLDMIVLRALATMGPLHAYALTARLEQIAEPKLTLKQGTLYPALVRLEQKGCIKGTWQTTESGREAKYYAITRAGQRALKRHVERWRLFSGLIEKLLTGES